jgi:hypothetical protein
MEANIPFNVATAGLFMSFIGIYKMAKQDKGAILWFGLGHVLMIGAMSLKGL